MSLTAASQAAFAPARVYLNTASAGLPPRPAVDALQAAIGEWAAGRAEPPGYDRWIERARASFARLAGTEPGNVAVGSQVSILVGLVAASLRPGSEVICAAGDFTSVLFPFLAQEQRGVTVRLVPLERMAESIRRSTTVVAVSAVQSADGRVADLAAIAAAASACGALTVIDATQALGWLPVAASQFDVVVCGAYKWLLSPRGTAFMAVRPDQFDRMIPNNAGWYAGSDPWTAVYDGPLRLAVTAKRFDTSPAWLDWVATAEALAFIEDVGVGEIGAHDVALANRFRAGLGLPPSNSAIVSVGVPGAAARLAASGIAAAERAGSLRVSFHLYNTASDVDAALDALANLVR